MQQFAESLCNAVFVTQFNAQFHLAQNSIGHFVYGDKFCSAHHEMVAASDCEELSSHDALTPVQKSLGALLDDDKGFIFRDAQN